MRNEKTRNHESYPYWREASLIALSFLIYYPILHNQLLDFWDDQWVVMNHYTEGGFNGYNLKRIFTEFYHGQYAPLNELLYLTLYSLFGYNPTTFHLCSILLHAANSCFVYKIIQKLFVFKHAEDAKKTRLISFITAVFFCIHPLNVESVAWMSASKVLVYSLFYLLAVYAFLLYIETNKKHYYILTILLYICSFLGKEQAVTFPVCLLLIYWFLNIKLLNRAVWTSVLPFFALSLLFGIITMMSQQANGEGVLTDEVSYPIWQRIVYGCYALFEYFYKSVFPFKLSYIYPFPSAVGDPLPSWLLFYPAMLLIIGISLWKYISQKMVLFGLLFFLIHIAVALHIIPLSRFTVVADRYAYLSIIGVGFILSWLFTVYYEKRSGTRRLVLIILTTAYFLYLGIYSNRRTLTWYNVDTLKQEIRTLLKQRNEFKTYNYE